MDYSTLNMNEDPSDPGLADPSYDHVIAVNTLRETKNAQQSLSDMRKLLRPNGRLFLQELCPSSRWVDCLLGVIPSWRSSPSERPSSTTVLQHGRAAVEACYCRLWRTLGRGSRR